MLQDSWRERPVAARYSPAPPCRRRAARLRGWRDASFGCSGKQSGQYRLRMLASEGRKVERFAPDRLQRFAVENAHQHGPQERKSVQPRVAGTYLAFRLCHLDERSDGAEGLG